MKILCKNKYWKINEDYDINKILYLLIDRPNRINFYNDFVWKNKQKQYHREYDLPTFIHNSGNVSWYINDNLHRKNNKSTRIWC